MADLRVYIATSLDGYVATPDGGMKWLEPFYSKELDFFAFIKQIGAVVVGRKTFAEAVERGQWFYGEMPVVVQTHRPLPEGSPKTVEAYEGDVRPLAERLKRDVKHGDVWLMGGGLSIRSFADHGLVDRWQVFIMPVLLGDGIPLFPRGTPGPHSVKLAESRAYRNGVVGLDYRRA